MGNALSHAYAAYSSERNGASSSNFKVPGRDFALTSLENTLDNYDDIQNDLIARLVSSLFRRLNRWECYLRHKHSGKDEQG